MLKESGVVKSWGQELEVESSRAEPGAWVGSSREPGPAKSGAKPSQESRGRAWAWSWAWRVCSGDWLRNVWSGRSNRMHYL